MFIFQLYGFYDDSILSGTKTCFVAAAVLAAFYDDSILSGTKTAAPPLSAIVWFYDDSILSGTKTGVLGDSIRKTVL